MYSVVNFPKQSSIFFRRRRTVLSVACSLVQLEKCSLSSSSSSTTTTTIDRNSTVSCDLHNDKSSESPDFARKFIRSLRQIEDNLNYSQLELEQNIRQQQQHPNTKPDNRSKYSIDQLSTSTTSSSLKSTSDNSATTSTSISTIVDSRLINRILESIQQKYGVKSVSGNGGGYLKSNLFYQQPGHHQGPPQYTHQSQQRKFQIEIPSIVKQPPLLTQSFTFDSIRPTESFLILTLANLFSSKLSKLFETLSSSSSSLDGDTCSDGVSAATTTDHNMKDYILLLLNIVQLIRSGSETREFSYSKLFSFQNLTSETSDSSEILLRQQQYRQELLKGNIYFYNVTYSLMRLNITNISDLMAESLRQISAAQYWLDREADTAFHVIQDCDTELRSPEDLPKLLISTTFGGQLLSGQLIQNWPILVYYREASLLGNGTKSMAYLLGKQFDADFELAQSLGCNLAYLLSLIDDYYQLKHLQRCLSANDSTTEISTISTQPTSCLNFFLRLPVLLYFKENRTDTRSLLIPSNDSIELIGRPTTEQLIHNVLTNIDQSDAMDKTLALIEHYANSLQKMVLGPASIKGPKETSGGGSFRRGIRQTSTSTKTDGATTHNESIRQMVIELLQVCADFDNHRTKEE